MFNLFKRHNETKKYIRGLIETSFDEFQSGEVLDPLLKLIKQLKPEVTNIEDTALGYVYGALWERYSTAYLSYLGRRPHLEETIEFISVLFRRASQLKSRIKETMMK